MTTTQKRTFAGIVFLLMLAVCGATANASVLKSPYLIYPGNNTQMEVLWQDTATETTNTLSWGLDTTYSMGSVTVAELASTSSVAHQHMYTITGLTPNTKYFYQVADATNGVYGSGSFYTAPSDSTTSIRFMGLGDSRSYPYALDALMYAMRKFYMSPGNKDYQRLTLHNGDWVSTDGESYWTSQWFDPTKTDIVNFTANTPIDGCKGNHDNGGSYPNGYSATFPKYFPFPYVNLTPTGKSDSTGNPYYNNLYWSFNYGPVHVTVLDEYSNFAPGSAQYTWLVNDLASATQPWKILMYHEPAYSAGADADNTTVRALEPLITQYGVDLTYSGHSHNYARTGAYNAAQAGGDQIALNVPHFTTGGGGAPIYQPDFTNAGSYPHVITAWPAYEFMTFDIEGKTLTVTAYQVNGVANASGSGTTATNLAGVSYSPIETIVLNHFTNVTSQVSSVLSPITLNSSTGKYTGTLTITNNGNALTGNVDVVLDGILNLAGIGNANNQYSYAGLNGSTAGKVTSKIAQNPACFVPLKNGPACTAALMSDVTLVNITGSNNGEPMVRATTSGLAPGATITVPLTFSNPNNETITFNPVVYQE
jgi:predicted phosphodiesterase